MSEPISQTVARACTLIEQWIGMTLSGAAPRRLYEFLERRAEALMLPGAARYVDLLTTASAHDPEVELLINLITNGLTAFWRDEPQLDAVRLALQQIGMTRALSSEPLAIWCAGCATGEEAYTLAMIAHEAGLSAHVLGTDINTEFLQTAREGVYGPWSLRRLSAARTSRYFHASDDADRFEVDAALKAMVSFSHHNLLAAGPLAPRRSGWDVVVCRNVLIYFKDETVRVVIDRFAEALDQDGYLMLGSSEQMSSYYDSARSPFRAAQHGAGFVHRLASKAPGTTLYKVPLLRERAPMSEVLGAPYHEELSELSEETVEISQDVILPELIEAGWAQFRAEPEHALACFEAAACYDPFTTDAHYAIAALLRDRAPRRAMEVLRKVLFLKPFHWLAAFELATLHDRLGEPTRAFLLYRQTLEGLARDEALFETATLERHLAPDRRGREQIAQESRARAEALSRG